MGILIELFLSLFGELLLHLVLSVLFDGILLAVESVTESRRARSAVLSVLVFMLLGAGIGGLSLLFASSFLIDLPGARVANLLLTPLAVGLVLAAAGTRRERKGKPRSALEYFAAGTALSFGIAVVRLVFAAG